MLYFKTSEVISMTVPVDDMMSPFTKDSYFWELRKTNHAVVNWHHEKLVNIIVFHLDNLDEKKLKLNKNESKIFIPAIKSSQKEIPRLDKDNIFVTNLNNPRERVVERHYNSFNEVRN